LAASINDCSVAVNSCDRISGTGLDSRQRSLRLESIIKLEDASCVVFSGPSPVPQSHGKINAESAAPYVKFVLTFDDDASFAAQIFCDGAVVALIRYPFFGVRQSPEWSSSYP
jgi:hypothetical protein